MQKFGQRRTGRWNDCFAIGCTEKIYAGDSFCENHWNQIPENLRLAIVRALHSYNELASDELLETWREQVQHAIDFLKPSHKTVGYHAQ